MKHVSAIKEIIETGDHTEAMDAIDNLLALGPNNMEALKLKAKLYAVEGKFNEEALVWEAIIKVDNEDPDAVNYLFKQQAEDFEHFNFTDDLPDGGRRYLTYPKAFFSISLIGFFGCVSFFAVQGLSKEYLWLASDVAVLASFMVLVMVPWLGIIWVWARSVKSVSIHNSGLTVETRFKVLKYLWTDMHKVVLAHRLSEDDAELRLVLVPKSSEQNTLVLDMADDTSSIKAKSHLLREVSGHFDQFDYDHLDHLDFPKGKITSY